MQTSQISFSSFEDRILKMKNKVVSQPHELCVERAKLFTESYKKTKGLNPIMRFAKAMEYYLNRMTIKIWDDEFIIGNRCTKYVGTPIYPEVRIDSVEQDINTYDSRPVQRMLLSEEEKRVLKEEIIPYWKNQEETVQTRFYKSLDSELIKLMNMLVYIVDAEMTNGIGHFFPGHENVLKYGFNGLIQKCQVQLSGFFHTTEEDYQKRLFLRSVLIVCTAIKGLIHRFSELAKSLGKTEQNSERKRELFEISTICSNIAENPPESFKEAIQLVYFTHLICGLEDGGFAISIGRLDQYLYPFYLKDIKEGRIKDNEVLFLIECFYLKLCTLWNYVMNKGVIATEGPPIAENLVIGGVDRAGTDATNELSFIMLEAYTRLKTVQPTFSVRIHEKTPESFLTKVNEAVKSGTSMSLFNDQVMIKGLVDRGLTLEDAREYAPIGCVEPQHPHKSFGSTNSNQINAVKCLELALTNGIDMVTKRNYGIFSEKKISNYDDLWNAFKEKLSFFIDHMVKTMYVLDKIIAELTPKPFLSATVDDCIKRGKDITRGGAVYNFTGPQLVGLATVADSLAVFKKLVFEEKLVIFDDMVEMLKKNYKGEYNGKKGQEWREIFLNKVPKFGNDDDYVDPIATEVAKFYCDEIVKYNNYRGGLFNPGIYSTSFHLAFGIFTGATADGRKTGEPISNGVSPSNGRDKNGPTAIFNSVAKLKNELITNGNTLTLAFHPNFMKFETFSPLLKSYFGSKGGYHVQFNVVGRETLCEAQKNPDNYRGLVVRIAGYSVLFTELSKVAQDDIIARTEY